MQVKYDNSEVQYSAAAEVDRPISAFGRDTLDAWREARTMRPLTGFFRSTRDGQWLTVGDGNFGLDAVLLKKMGVKNVHASDMSDHLLRLAKAKGFIDDFSQQNAESLTFGDDAFDYVFCKSAFHHFPRPILATYEMLRVAKRAVVLVEPPDPTIGFSLRSLLQRGVGRDFHDFEDVGNYVYSVSEREFEKLLLGLGLRWCAFRTGNDLYSVGIEQVPATGGSMKDHLTRAKVKTWGMMRDALTSVRVMAPNTITCVLFKTEPTEEERVSLQGAGFRLRTLPENPYRK